MTFSGNPLRDGAILSVVRELQAINDPLTLANVGLVCEQRYGATFSGNNDLLQSELDGALAMLAPAAEPVAEAAPDAEPEAEQPEVPAITREEAHALARLAADNVLAARRDLQDKQRIQKAARAKAAEAITSWQRGGLRALSPDENIRQVLRSNQLQREQNANRSTAATAKAFTQKRMLYGNRRATPLAPGQPLQRVRSLLQLQTDRILQANAARAKLPSER